MVSGSSLVFVLRIQLPDISCELDCESNQLKVLPICSCGGLTEAIKNQWDQEQSPSAYHLAKMEGRGTYESNDKR
jgi:hypothetical protein